MKFFEKNIITDTFFIPKDITISGNIEGKISGRIEGLIKGDVKINGKVIVSESGIIGGSLKCYEVVVQGIIQGDVIAHNSVTVLPGGVIEGNVSSNSINVDSKANVRGNIRKTATAEATHVASNGQLQKVANQDASPKKKESIPVKPNFNQSSDEEAPKSNFW